MNRKIELPGVLWVALLVGLPMLAQWLETYFGELPWALPLAGMVLIVAKIVQVYAAAEPADPIGGDVLERAQFDEWGDIPVEQPSRLPRLLWG
jgi:hypothetical protein